MRRTFDMTDLVEIMAHWYAGRSYTQVARSLGIDRGTVVKYTARPGPRASSLVAHR
jgi:DNA-binding CsgD family transcriptional regulator